MPDMPPVFRPHRSSRSYEQDRGNAHDRGYDAAWRRESAAYRARHPLCRYCALDGHVKAAELVDHLYPHRGDRAVFWERAWWVSSCKACHDGFKQMIERQGRAALDALAVRLGLPVRRPPG